mmetsp:Transcript_8702/g.18043  ORF Transcript_8702/g.18043 Transcript_8702/m.18043 type:complete len:236 (+) Transcript_8702:278-985(+)|eukprot:CAMPEP_0118932670 /NCGR_PEP_ID=MMETSP1169-20130426/10559_1 /TAXON_ID=36882 /ORGANISM="Pyramimonas obovata, Strain CCMP722" /LENGTH=235 /DNA_ID=CAMNT_0006875365 /DNA_START=278 /DNA_END=985 /DNA_ORIENTATION=+
MASEEATLPEIKETTLPEIKPQDPVPTSDNLTRGAAPPKESPELLDKLPEIRPKVNRRKPKQVAQPGPTAEESKELLHSERSYQVYAMPRRQNLKANEWKKDVQMSEWYRLVQKRKTDAAKKKIRQASQEANWILERRETQMKNLRDRQKAEETEARMRELQLIKTTKAYQAAHRKSQFGPSGDKDSGDEQEENHEFGLSWQMTKPVVSHGRRPAEYSVWCSPGHFTTKTVMDGG